MSVSTPLQPPPQMIATEDIIPTTRQLLDRFKKVRDEIVQTVNPDTACFRNVLQPVIDVENETNGGIAVIAMLQYASPIAEARQASERAVALMSESWSEAKAREDIYLLIKAVHEKGEDLNAEQQQYLKKELKDYQRFGHGLLSPAQIEEYSRTRNKIEELQQQFNRNVREEDSGLLFSLEDLEGVPADDLSRFNEEKGPDGQELRLVRFRRAEITSVLKYATKTSTRKKLFIAGAARFPENDRLFKQIVTLRDENARMLGYSSHAAFRIEKRVAKTVDWVEDLANKIEEALLPVAQKEMDKLRAIKAEFLQTHGAGDDDSPEDVLNPWDVDFYSRIASDALSVDVKKIAEFFPLEHVQPAMLDVFASCLQLRFVRAPPELVDQSKWHPDVEAWCVWDDREASKDEFIGYLFLDVVWRPGKYKGNQCVNLQSGHIAKDGKRVYPATILMCSFAESPVSPSPLLEHSQLVTMFHELGHGIHDLVSRTAYTAFHGWNAPSDFAEAPSTMLENWCWLPHELKQMSCHYTKLGAETPERIPDAMIESLVRSRSMNRALWFLRQLALARYDLAVHNPPSHQSCEEMNPAEIYAEFYDRLTLVNHPCPDQRGYPHADFTHLVSGYDAGYYSYLAAQVFAADLFETVFARNPRDRARWEDYRRSILEPGGSRDGLEMLTTFLGHVPDASALLKQFA
ncbi:hypothetical protein NLU13_9280 [Sarocladium strictum]|uniref:Peptidase M3A/M3B catalytic domain-containing protein n=1 Tax=Sarocladium strictum TaxID=5046 RepID=A0AA39GC21_SARSR|nr:hypothetical protein NLU13_9280 [Sarocladium strictum]